MRKKTECNGKTIETYGLSDGQHQAAVKAISNNLRSVNNYKVVEVDEEMVEVWEEDAKDVSYKEFLSSAIEKGADVYTLNDTIGGFSQPIGEIIVY